MGLIGYDCDQICDEMLTSVNDATERETDKEHSEDLWVFYPVG